MDATQWGELGQQLRVDSVRSSAAAGSGHPTSSMSAADLMAVLHRRAPALRRRQARRPQQRPPDLLQGSRVAARVRDAQGDGRPRRRRAAHVPQVRSRACRATRSPTCRWSTWPPARWARACPSASASPSPASAWTACPTACGCCAATRELAEGSIWEAFEHAAYAGLDNLDRDPRHQPARPARRDHARLGPRATTPAASRPSAGTRSRSTATTSRRSTAPTPRPAADPGKPTAIVAKTVKGKGVAAVENKNGFHGKPLDDPDAAIAELGGVRDLHVDVAKPDGARHAARLRRPAAPPLPTLRARATRSPPARPTATP